MKTCLNCGKELTGRKTKYCSNACQQQYNRKQLVHQWLNGEVSGTRGNLQISAYVRWYLLEQSGYKCSCCGWGEKNPFTNTIPLEIHHKDSNPNNNSLDNLQVLCPNCHSLQKNWKGSNKNSLRTYRKKQS